MAAVSCARASGLETRDVRGMHYDPWTRRARLGVRPTVNYLATFTREAA